MLFRQEKSGPGCREDSKVELFTLKGLRFIPMPKIKANGIDLYYEIHGSGDPLVVIMGLRRNAEWWYCQIPTLSEHFQVLVFDNRGAGRSDQPAREYSIPLFADDTAALMQGLGLSSAHVLGISMGGYIAQELKEMIPQARLEFFPAGRHCFFMEFAPLFNQQVIDFLQNGKRGNMEPAVEVKKTSFSYRDYQTWDQDQRWEIFRGGIRGPGILDRRSGGQDRGGIYLGK